MCALSLASEQQQPKKKKNDCNAQLHDYAALGIPKAGISREKKVDRVGELRTVTKPPRQGLLVASIISLL